MFIQNTAEWILSFQYILGASQVVLVVKTHLPMEET